MLQIFGRLVHTPRSFGVAKTECSEIGGTLLSLANTQQVFGALGYSMVGNVPSEYRIDGRFAGNWLQEEDQVIEEDNFISSSIWRGRTLALNLEDGTVSNTHSVDDLLGFVCQAKESELTSNTDCNGTAERDLKLLSDASISIETSKCFSKPLI